MGILYILLTENIIYKKTNNMFFIDKHGILENNDKISFSKPSIITHKK